MGKKKQNKNKRGTDLQSEDVQSEGSNDTGFSYQRSDYAEDDMIDDNDVYDMEQEEKLTSEEDFYQKIEDLSDRSRKVRVEALETLCVKLEQCLTPTCIIPKLDTLQSNLITSLRRATTQEAILIARIVALISVTLGSSEQEFFTEMKRVFRPHLFHAKEPQLQIAMLESLSMLHFVMSSDYHAALSWLTFLTRFFTTDVNQDVCRSAMDCFGLLLVSSPAIPQEDFVEHLYVISPSPILMTAQEENDGEDDEDVVEAHDNDGESGYLFEVLIHLLETSIKDYELERAIGEVLGILYEQYDGRNLLNENERHAIESIFQELAIANVKKSGKKEKRKEYRKIFRELAKHLETQEPMTTTLVIQEETLTFRGWEMVKPLTLLTKCLNAGLQEHLAFNPILRQLFDFSPPPQLQKTMCETNNSNIMKTNTSTKLVKQDKTSDKRKKQTFTLARDRRRKEAQKMMFLDE